MEVNGQRHASAAVQVLPEKELSVPARGWWLLGQYGHGKQ
jgi:hypothetical protein